MHRNPLPQLCSQPVFELLGTASVGGVTGEGGPHTHAFPPSVSVTGVGVMKRPSSDEETLQAA